MFTSHFFSSGRPLQTVVLFVHLSSTLRNTRERSMLLRYPEAAVPQGRFQNKKLQKFDMGRSRAPYCGVGCRELPWPRGGIDEILQLLSQSIPGAGEQMRHVRTARAARSRTRWHGDLSVLPARTGRVGSALPRPYGGRFAYRKDGNSGGDLKNVGSCKLGCNKASAPRTKKCAAASKATLESAHPGKREEVVED